MNVYTIDHLTYSYPKQPRPANKDISLEIAGGEVFGILGDNGAGKTTLVRQMVGLLTPDRGRITLYGKDVRADAVHVTTRAGYMPQEARALTNLRAGEALFYTARLRGLNRADAARERDRLLDLWQAGDIRDKVSSKLSGGERRLMRLAVAMAGKPPVLILDEPTNDLAPQRRRLVWDVLGQMNREQGTTIIFVTHDAIEAERAIQRVGILRGGELVAVGAPSDLKKEVDRTLRLELFVRPPTSPRLPPGLEAVELQPGWWITWIDRDDASSVLAALDMAQVEDFHLYSATLEDLYVHYTNPQG